MKKIKDRLVDVAIAVVAEKVIVTGVAAGERVLKEGITKVREALNRRSIRVVEKKESEKK